MAPGQGGNEGHRGISARGYRASSSQPFQRLQTEQQVEIYP